MSLFDSQLVFLSMGSGSCGNCYYLGTLTDAILIDAGIGIRRMMKYMTDYGLKRDMIRAILLTHDHNDHVKSAAAFSEKLGVPVYASAMVHEGILKNKFISKKIKPENRRNIELGATLQIGDFSIYSFPIPHDSAANTGYTIRVGETVFSLMTDVGCVTEEVNKAISESTHVVLEANYDPQMLQTGPYPYILKQRISNGHGHLSNIQTGEALIRNMHPGLRYVWLCHLSAENNKPELAFSIIASMLSEAGYDTGTDLQLVVLNREKPTGIFTIG